MRRIAVAVSMLLALTLGVAIPSAGGQPRAQKSALRLLETLTVPGLASTPVTTRTTLRKGASYRLVVTGIVTSSITKPDGVTIGEREDAFYCYEETNEAAVDPGNSCTRNIRYSGVLRWRNGNFNDHVVNALGLKAQPAYQPSHRYVLRFRAPKRGKLAFAGVRLPSLSPVGSFKLELYGSAAKKKKARKKKKRKSGCPALRTSDASARASASCSWVVDFVIQQFGKPEDDPFPDPSFVSDAETSGLARVFFNRKPKEGRSARGSVAGVFYYEESLNSFDQTGPVGSSVYRLQPTFASYTLHRNDDRELVFDAVVVDSQATPQAGTGQPPPTGCSGGDLVGFRLFDDRFDRDRMRLSFRRCKGHGSGTYRYTHDPINDQELQIEMSQPKRL